MVVRFSLHPTTEAFAFTSEAAKNTNAQSALTTKGSASFNILAIRAEVIERERNIERDSSLSLTLRQQVIQETALSIALAVWPR